MDTGSAEGTQPEQGVGLNSLARLELMLAEDYGLADGE